MLTLRNHKPLKELGSGHFATAYEAEQVETGCRVAVKVFNRKRVLEEDAKHELMCMKLAGHHKNVIKLIDFEFDQYDYPHAVMELMSRGSLSSLLSKCYRFRGFGLTNAEVRYCARQILEGVQHLHDNAGFIHRDLKPGNILVSDNLELKISDFGSCYERIHQHRSSLDIMTVPYSAPEVLMRTAPAAPHTAMDMWSVGCTLAELFLGSFLFPSTRHDVGKTFVERCWFQLDKIQALLVENGNVEADVRSKLAKRMPQASPLAVDLIARLINLHPGLRPTAREALQHPFFWNDVDSFTSNEEAQKSLIRIADT